MKISFTGDAMRYMDHNTGYGQASEMIYKTFKKMGIDCGFEIKNPDIEICFASPETHYWLNKNLQLIARDLIRKSFSIPNDPSNYSILYFLFHTRQP